MVSSQQARNKPGEPDGKARLIEGAIQCVAEHGMVDSTVRKIAQYANVTPGLIRHHYGNKINLLAASYRHLNQVALTRMETARQASNEDFEESIRTTLLAFFPEDLRDVGMMRVLVAFWIMVLSHEEFAEVQKETNAGFHKFLTDMIESHLGPRDDLDMLADGVMAIVDGLWLECCMNPDRMKPEDAIEAARMFCEMALEPRD